MLRSDNVLMTVSAKFLMKAYQSRADQSTAEKITQILLTLNKCCNDTHIKQKESSSLQFENKEAIQKAILSFEEKRAGWNLSSLHSLCNLDTCPH